MINPTRSEIHGAALINALLAVAMISTVVAKVIEIQTIAIENEALVRDRTQADHIIFGAIDYARLILREDVKSNSFDAPTEAWAVPLNNIDIESFLDAVSDLPPPAQRAMLSGKIVDLQSKYNLTNMGTAPEQNTFREEKIFRDLCKKAGIPAGAADFIANQIKTSWSHQKSGGTINSLNATPRTPHDLSWFAGGSKILSEQLSEVFTILPESTPININTADTIIIAATLNIDQNDARELQKNKPIKSLESIRKILPDGIVLDPAQIDVKSSWFEVNATLKLSDKKYSARAILDRRNLDVPIAKIEKASS